MDPRARDHAGRRHLGALTAPGGEHPSLAPQALLYAYAAGAFPMDEEGARGPVGIFEADPRGVMPIAGFRVPRSVARGLRRHPYEIRVDAAFDLVAAACAVRPDDTWLTPRLCAAYGRLHRLGHAHSVEAWKGGELVGGLFGVALRRLFTSETMFHRAPDAGNAVLVAAAALVRAGGFTLWDIQMVSPHTVRFGAAEVTGAEYRRRLSLALRAPAATGPLAGAL